MRSVPVGAGAVTRAPTNAAPMNEKVDDVTHYIHSHAQHAEHVSVEPDGQLMNVQMDPGSRLVTAMHPAGYPSHVCRQVSLGGDGVLAESGSWGGEELIATELTEEDGRLAAALVAHLAGSNSRVTQVRQDVDQAALMGSSMRLFNNQGMGEDNGDTIVVEVPNLTPLQEINMKSGTWYHTKPNKDALKESQQPSSDGDPSELSPAAGKHSRKSLPHKKRISRKLRRPGAGTPHREAEEILPDSYAPPGEQSEHMAHEVRPILICQICGDFYGEEQLKFFHHLKQHYEPHGATIIIENPVPQMQPVGELALGKMSSCIVDNVAPLPEALVELSLENSATNKMSLYHSVDRHTMYTTGDKTLSFMGNKCTYSTAVTENEHEARALYEPREQPLYSCTRCNRSFRKQKLCEAHIEQAHSNKADEMSEFSEPEDLMEGIHVLVEGETPADGADEAVESGGGYLTVEGGHVHQEHMKHWYQLASGAGHQAGVLETPGGVSCAVCAAPLPTREALDQHINHCPMHFKEEVLHRIFEVEADCGNNTPLSPAMILENGDVHTETAEHQEAMHHQPADNQPQETPAVVSPSAIQAKKDKKKKVFECKDCNREFKHRNSLLYHLISHKGIRSHKCMECDKSFFTMGALKIHERIHTGSKPYKCSKCDKNFRQWGDLKYHVVSIHTTKKNYKCDYCGKEFARKYSLNLHIRIHTGERNYPCGYCNKSFRASSYRLTHMRTHTGSRPFPCDLCEKRFRAVGDLRRHQLVHQKVRLRIEEKPRRSIKAAVVKLVNIKIQESTEKPVLMRNNNRRRAKPLPGEEEILPDQYVLPEPHWDKSPRKDPSDPELACGKVENCELKRRLEQKRSNDKLFRSVTTFSHRSAPEGDSKPVVRHVESPPRNITPFEHLQKREASGSHSQIHISDVRSYATKPGEDIPGQGLENHVFLERLTALYSIEQVT